MVLGHLGLRQEQVGGQESAQAHVAAVGLENMVVASQGFDIPAYANLMDMKVWAKEGPPKGTLFTTRTGSITRKLDRRGAGAGEDCRADLRARHDDQDGHAPHAG